MLEISKICPPLKILAFDSASIYDDETFPSYVYSVKKIQKEDAKDLLETDKYDGTIVEWNKDKQAEILLEYIMSNYPDIVKIVVTSSLNNNNEFHRYSNYLNRLFCVDDLLIRDSAFKKKKIHDAIFNAIINRYRCVPYHKFATCNGGNTINFNNKGDVVFAQDQATAQKYVNTITEKSSNDDILQVLAIVRQELQQSDLPTDVKEEVKNEVDDAEIQVKKEEPDKKKIADKLQSATDVLEKAKGTFSAAVGIGNMIGKAIEWCGEKWIQWG